jgi:cytochrome c2
MARYLAAMGHRKDAPVTPPDPAQFPQAKLDLGKNIFLLRCTECHTLGNVIVTPLAKQQGPDLIRVANRVDFDWAKKWISNPHAVDPKTRMTVPGITPEQVDAVRMFVWKTAIENGPTKSAAR